MRCAEQTRLSCKFARLRCSSARTQVPGFGSNPLRVRPIPHSCKTPTVCHHSPSLLGSHLQNELASGSSFLELSLPTHTVISPESCSSRGNSPRPLPTYAPVTGTRSFPRPMVLCAAQKNPVPVPRVSCSIGPAQTSGHSPVTRLRALCGTGSGRG